MMSRGCGYLLLLDRAGPVGGISGTLRREGWRECCGYSEVSMW
jgi:hypothetical protein